MPPRRVVAVSLAVAATLPGDALLYAVLPVVWSQLGLELWMVGILLSANRFVRLATNPLSGWVAERVGIQRPFTAAVFATVGVSASYAFAPGFAAFLAARVAWGLLWSFLRLGGYLAALSVESQRRGYALGFCTGVANLGTLVAMAFGGLLTDQLGFRTTVLCFAVLALPAGVAMLREGRLASTNGAPPREEEQGDEESPPAGTRWAVYAAAFVIGSSSSPLVLATLGLWLSEQYGDSVALGSLVLGVATLNGALLGVRFALQPFWAPVSGHLSDRMGRLSFAAVAGGVSVAGLLALSLPGALTWTVSMALLVFLAGVALRVSCDALAGDAAPVSGRARFMSWYANASDLGSATGPFLAYLLADAVGVAWAYRVGAAFLALAGTAVLLQLRRSLHP